MVQYETAKVNAGAWRARMQERDSHLFGKTSAWKQRIDRYIALRDAFERRRQG